MRSHSHHLHPHRHPCERESGAALIIALFVSILALGITLSGTITMQANRTRTETRFLMDGQVTEVACSGLTEALNWFRRQDSQPVEVFAPIVDATASPPVLDTIDPDIGLVREFPIYGEIWGRYEVWKEWEGDPDPVRLQLRRALQAEDISDRSLRVNDASSWLVKSVGFVFHRRDPGQPFDAAPNRVIGTTTLECEFSRAFLKLPGLAAVNARMGGPVNVHEHATVLGGSEAAGIYFLSNNGSPNINKAIVNGTPSVAPASIYDDSPESIFGMSEDALRAMADYYITDEADLPLPIPPLSIVFVEDSVSNLRFDDTRPLRGSGILYIKGGIQMKYGSNSDFKGLIYAHSASSMDGPAKIRGSVVVRKALNMGSNGPGKLMIQYNRGALDALRAKFENYRISSAIRNAHHSDGPIGLPAPGS